MKKLVIPAAGAGGIWLAGKALGLAEAGMTRLLMAMGMDWGHAAARAPVAVWAALAVLCGVAAVSLTAWEEAERGRRMAAAETNRRDPKREKGKQDDPDRDREKGRGRTHP